MRNDDPFFLFLGHSDADAVVSKLKAAGVPYRKKLLESAPENWDRIIEILQEPNLRGVVAVANGSMWMRLLHDEWRAKTPELLKVLGEKPHVLLVHEDVLTGGPDEPPPAPGEDDDAQEPWFEPDGSYRWEFMHPDADQVTEVLAMLDAAGINVRPYRTNAEKSVLAAGFVDDNEKHLLFRVYMPSGRLYAHEADRLLSLFRDWLAQTGRGTVRQDGYATSAGKVYEFYGDDALKQGELAARFEDFAGFMELCVAEPGHAVSRLLELGVEARSAESLVTRYAREVRRLHLDLRQSRETRLLELKHSFESELLDGTRDPSPGQQLLEALVAVPATVTSALLAAEGGVGAPAHGMTINVNQQIIGQAHAAVVQSVQGVTHLGPQAQELLDLAERFGGSDAAALRSAVHEMEDPDARDTDRLRARQHVKGFLFRLTNKLEDVAIKALVKYVETKAGLG